jgi:hypothetical protein
MSIFYPYFYDLRKLNQTLPYLNYFKYEEICAVQTAQIIARFCKLWYLAMSRWAQDAFLFLSPFLLLKRARC